MIRAMKQQLAKVEAEEAVEAAVAEHFDDDQV